MRHYLYFVVCGLIGCGSVGDHSRDTDFSLPNISGNYILGTASCTEGQFDPTQGKDFLNHNDLIQFYKREGFQVSVTIDTAELRTTAPSTFFGGKSLGCSVTTVEKISYSSNQSVNRRLNARLCSSTCSTADCKEEKQISSGPQKISGINFIQNRLQLIDMDSAGACISRASQFPAQVEYLKR